VEKFSLKKLNDIKVKEQYQVKISNRFAALVGNFLTSQMIMSFSRRTLLQVVS